MAGLPLLFSTTGPVATPPATIRTTLINSIAASVPDYTANLPGSLIEDLASTDVQGIITIDQARVDAVNSVTPYAANPYVLAQQGLMLGVPQGLQTNGNAYLVFAGSAGYVIPPGFIASDGGTNTFQIQDGGTVGSNGVSQPLYAVATIFNTGAIPPNTITAIVTAVPSPYTLTVTNPTAGVPAEAAETTEQYRSQVLTAQQVAISGSATYLKTLLLLVPGVSPRLVSVLQSGLYWEVICGGGDPYQVAGAIYAGVSSLGLLTGSQANANRNITVSIFDAPDSYTVTFVNPPQQTVTVAVTWNTSLPNFTAQSAVNQYIILAVQSYINGIIVGQPINLLVLQEYIQLALAPVLPATSLTRLLFAVAINGEPVTPTTGTFTIPSDPESFMFVSPTGATSAQG